MSLRQRKGAKRRTRTVPLLLLALVVVTGIVGYLIYSTSQSSPNGNNDLIGKPVSQAVMSALSGVSTKTLTTIAGGNNIPSPSSISSSSPLISNGKPEILYIGADYCPYCATERWALVVALSKFGSFSNLTYMLSGPPPEAFPNTATFSFSNAVYTSNYIAFVAVEQQDRLGKPLQTASADQRTIMNTYNSQGSIPFLDFGNKYALVGTQVSPDLLRNKNWTQIASQLDDPNSQIAQSVDAAANRLIATICKLTQNQPSDVCSLPFVQTLSFAESLRQSGRLLISNEVTPVPSVVGKYRFRL